MAGTRSQGPSRLVIVDGDESLTKPLAYTLETAGFHVKIAATGNAALRLIVADTPEVVLLDIMIPDISGLEVCRRIRAAPLSHQPAIIIATTTVDESARVACFASGADDFVAKPFSISELVLRIRARMRAWPTAELPVEPEPIEPPPPVRSVTIGPLVIDGDSYRVFLGGKEVKLSVQEMRLLSYLASEPNRMRSRQDLLTGVWGYHPDASSRTLACVVARTC
jgi:two-component system, OmpR family, phosphate regulon response regulator PhoB